MSTSWLVIGPPVDQSAWSDPLIAVYEDMSVHAVRNNLGYIYFIQGKHEKAVQEYIEALKVKPDFSEAHLNLSKLYYKMKDDSLAVHHAKLALQHGSIKDEVEKVLMLIEARK